MFKLILIPVNDDPMSEYAVKVGVDIAQKYEAQLVLLHVSEPLPTYTRQAANYLPEGEMDRAASEHGRALLERFSELVPETTPCRLILRPATQRIWRDILDVRVELEADMIIIGTHGRDGVVRAFVGSIAEHVARHALVPVMLVR